MSTFVEFTKPTIRFDQTEPGSGGPFPGTAGGPGLSFPH
jgi:hypothetical protein